MVRLKKPNSVFCLTVSKTASKYEGRKTEGKIGFGFRVLGFYCGYCSVFALQAFGFLLYFGFFIPLVFRDSVLGVRFMRSSEDV